MNLQEILDLVNYVSNKEQSGNTLSPKEYNTLLPVVSLDYFKFYYGLPEYYRPGQPLPSIAWEITQKVTDTLKHLKVWLGDANNPPLSIDDDGVALIPSDYIHVSSINFKHITNKKSEEPTIIQKQVEVLFDTQFKARLASFYKQPSKKYPICCFYNNYIQFYPKDLKYVDFTYLRMPLTPYYDYYIVNATDQIVYLQPGETSPSTGVTPTSHLSTSVELEYPQDTHIDFARFLLGYIGINLREQQLSAYAESKKQTGV